MTATGHTIPRPVPSPALPHLMVEPAPEHEARAVREYVDLETSDESVLHLERVASERVFHEKHDVWDVHTNKNRWGVKTNPNNLYLQREFPEPLVPRVLPRPDRARWLPREQHVQCDANGADYLVAVMSQIVAIRALPTLIGLCVVAAIVIAVVCRVVWRCPNTT